MKSQFFEDYATGVSRTSTGRTITEADVVLHAGQTGDFFPHHMDAEWCKSQPFKQRIAHGTLIFSIAVGLSATVINEVSMTYGYERLRFLKPVCIGDTIKARVTIKEKKDHPKRNAFGLVTEMVEAFNQHGELVMICDHILMVEKNELKNSQKIEFNERS